MSKFGWFLGGALVGAAVALLLAPESGEITREKIAAMVKEKFPQLSKEELEKFVDKMMSKLNVDTIDADVEEY
ncbi:MAG: YtxH domain-containing protein [Paludibacteraceae bacterium]|nr:YtxH domain-containing protein [Paludibacteraceae bacterium]